MFHKTVAKKISDGNLHVLPADLKKSLLASSSDALMMWEDITPLARSEWICWVESVKKVETRNEHIKRVSEELVAGKRRPCCWVGCMHRTGGRIWVKGQKTKAK